ncbi:MAG: glutathione S-transferase C-terminal domain-containing protein [Alphaproteobacteria bacterium]|nr:glutathione S-transferase C-terminal domain-containing protein [Alphaproteobacteria bacterium]MCB9793621.1 glutathione S-transferase C-terminal domain-containing protein [Alphaproteobacteria bacterium]
MARMIDGVWEGEWRPTDEDGDGAFLRKASVFRDQIPPEAPEPGRYHLFVAWTCPWAHRTLLVRALKGLSEAIPVHFANALTDRSWSFEDRSMSPHGDQHLYELYLRADPHYTGRVTVPVLWDAREQRIVNNESSEILAMLDALPSPAPSLRPEPLRAEIADWSERMYGALNNGVYRAGFATTQAAYDEAVEGVFDVMAQLDARLAGRHWLVGEQLTEADLRLFVTAFRFDGAYYSLFRCNLGRWRDFPNLQAHLERVYALPGVAETCNLAAMRRGYASVQAVNPSGIVPAGPRPLVGERG